MSDPYHEQTPEGGEPLAGDDPVLLKDPVVDALLRMLLELTAELWVERERRIALEDVLDATGVISRQAVEDYRPAGARAAALKGERDHLINGVFKELRRLAQSA